MTTILTNGKLLLLNPLIFTCHTRDKIINYAFSLFHLSELKNTLETHVNEIKTQIESKCVLQ
jgi:hypothetical protein